MKRNIRHASKHRELSTKALENKGITEDSACLGAHLFALEFKSHFPKETTQKMVSSPSHSSNLFNAYLVKPQ